MRRWPWIVLLACLVLVGGHFALWYYEASQLDAGFAAWLAARRAEGWRVSTGATERGGWPMAATLAVPDLRLAGGEQSFPGGLAWRADRLDLRLDLFAPTTLTVNAAGTQHLRLAGAPDIAFTAASMAATLPLTGTGMPDSFVLNAQTLRAGTGGVTGPDSMTVGLASLDGTMPASGPSTWHLSAEAIALPADRAWALGNRISSVSAEMALSGSLPPAGSPAAQAAAWRDGGGKLEIRRLALGWGPLGLSGTATLTLDQRLQPAGTADVHLIGYAAALDALVSGRVLTSGAGLAAKAVLSLLAGTQDNGGPSSVDVPLTLQDRTLMMREAPLFRLPEVIWSETVGKAPQPAP